MTIESQRVRQFLRDLVTAVREEVQPLCGNQELVGETSGGDIVSLADQRAAETVRQVCEKGPYPVSLLLEEEGTFEDFGSRPVLRIVVDELDGSRPFRSGMPTCCVCAAALPADEDPVLRNVRWAAIAPLTGGVFVIERGVGVQWGWHPFRAPAVQVPFTDAIVHFEVVGAHPILLGGLVAPFWKSNKRGLLSFASGSFSAVCLAKRQAHLYLHLPALLQDVFSETYALTFLKGGAWGQYPWDLAASIPLLWETGCVVTTARGTSLADVRLDDASAKNLQSVVAAVNEELHERALAVLREAERRLRHGLEGPGVVPFRDLIELLDPERFAE